MRKNGRLALAAGAALVLPQAGMALDFLVAGQVVAIDTPAGYELAEVAIGGPGEWRGSASVAAAGRVELSGTLPDGAYVYQIIYSARTAGRSAGHAEDGRDVGGALARSDVRQGGFALVAGKVVPAGDTRSRRDEPEAKDQVIPDDLITQGSGCFGFDCVNNESFGFDTVRLKENNTQIAFDDTSTQAGFAANDWILRANDAGSGGASRFMLVDNSSTRIPVVVEAAAPANALYVDSTGKLGFRTPAPVLDLHMTTNDTPAIRFEQTNAGGFAAQTWDIGANEANFFVRDVTGGSRLSLRIRPGAPTSSIDVAATGNVGFGTASPDAQIDAQANLDPATPKAMLRVTNVHTAFALPDRFTVDSNGNVTARGAISQLSSRLQKESFERTNGKVLLAKLEALDIPQWRYRDAPDDQRHLGPTAEDFHAAFGLGADPSHIAISDLAGVALASTQALQRQVAARDARIAELEARLARLERAIEAITDAGR